DQQRWVQLVNPVEQDYFYWIIEKLVRAFIEDDFKDSTAITEIVLLGPILSPEMYRSLLSCFIGQFEQTKLLDATLLQGLVQLIECAFVGELMDDDLVRIATVLFKELSLTHNGTSDHVLLLTLALGRVLDVMVAGQVKDMNRDRDHQPMLQLLAGLRDSGNAYLKYQAAYAYQALQYAPDDETPLQVVWRYSKLTAAGASAVTSVFKLDPAGFIRGIENLQELAKSVAGVVKAGIDGYSTLRQGAGRAVRATEDSFDTIKKRSWYLALQGTAFFIRQGRLYDFKQVVFQAPCRHNANFQWGVCRQLGEIAIDPLWEDKVHQQAVEFLGEIYRCNTDWKPNEDVKRWILTILLQISGLENSFAKDRAYVLLKELKSDGATELPGIFPLRARLPLPVSFPLLIRVQEIPKVEYDLYKLRMQRIDDQLTTNLHTTNALNQAGQRDTKLLITCRTQYLGPDYRERFVPNSSGHYQRGTNELLLEAVIVPFSMSQIELYVEKYVPLEPRTWVKKDYMDKLTIIPNLMDLVKNPFLLTLALEALPDVVEGKTDLARLRITRVELYDTFAKHWLSVNKRRLQALKLKDEKQEALEDLLSDGFERNGIDFQKRLAVAIFRGQEGRPVVEYSHRRDKGTWKKEFFGTEADVILLREASLLSRAGNLYRFIHRSMLEYFFSCSIWDTTRSDKEFDLEAYLGSTGDNLSVDSHLLSMRNLVPEPSIIQFLVERIRIPGADVTAGQFDSARLEDSNLTGVTLANAWIRCTDFSRAQMEGVRFCELPWIKEDQPIESCAVSPDGKTFATGLWNGDICIYNIATWVKAHLLHGHKQRVESLAFSPSGFQLLSGSGDKTVRLWNCKTGLTDCILENHTGAVKAVTFSPSGKQMASASDDCTVRLWDAQTGAALFVLEDHTDCVTGIAYSPDGNTVVSCSKDELIRMFDTCSGKLSQKSQTCYERYECIAYSSDGQKIIVGSSIGILGLWKTDVNGPIIKWHGHDLGVSSVQFSPNDEWILSTSGDNTVKLWEAQTDRVANNISPSNDIAAYSPDGRSLLSGGHSGILQLYNADTGELCAGLHSYAFVNHATYSPNGLQIAVAGIRGGVTLLNAQSHAVEYFIHTGNAAAFVTYSSCGQWIALGMRTRGVEVWDTRSVIGQHIYSSDTLVASLAFSPNGLNLAVGHVNGDICVLEIRTWSCKMVIKGGHKQGACVVYPPESPHLSCYYRSGTEGIRMFDEKGQNIRTILEYEKFNAELFAYSSCGRWIAAVKGQMVHLWMSTSSGMESNWAHATTVEGFSGSVMAVAWRPNTTEFATTSMDKSIRVWKVDGESAHVSVQMLWSHGLQALTAPSAVLVGSIGLSTTNRKLLEQRGAIFESNSSVSDGA
ncbi:hypothetical protein BGZ95_011672, partial [Linnemannia exigua]